jgi:uncharacterized protein YkwD
VKLQKRILATTATVALLVTVTPGGPAPSAHDTPSFDSRTKLAGSTCWDYKRPELRFTRKMNKARDNNDQVRMNLDRQLSRAARKHTWEMVNQEVLHHTPTPKLKKRVTNWSVLGENVGVGGTVDSLHKAFMNSPAHRANILYSSFRHVGVGVVKKSDGRMWVTVIFEAAKNPGTTLRMPKSC